MGTGETQRSRDSQSLQDLRIVRQKFWTKIWNIHLQGPAVTARNVWSVVQGVLLGPRCPCTNPSHLPVSVILLTGPWSALCWSCCPRKRGLNPWIRLGNGETSPSCTQRHSPSLSVSPFPFSFPPFLSSFFLTFPLLSQWFVNLFCCCCCFCFRFQPGIYRLHWNRFA